MKKLMTIIFAALTACCLMAAPAFAAEERTVLGQDPSVIETYQTWEIIPTILSEQLPPTAFDVWVPDLNGHNLPPKNSDEKYVMYESQVQVTDTEEESGEHLIEAKAPNEQWAISAVCNKMAEVDPDGTVKFGEIQSGEVAPTYVSIEVIDVEAYDETIYHEGVEPVIETVSDGWAKCDKDGQSSYVFTGDKLIIHDGQTGYWFWSLQPMDNWREFAASTGINKAGEVNFAKSGYGTFSSKADEESKHIIGNKTFTIEPNLIYADGGISWVAWEHLRNVVVTPGEEPWEEVIHHDAEVHSESFVSDPGYGWANVTYMIPEVPDEPVVPDVPDEPAPVDPQPIPDTPGNPVEEPEVVVPEPVAPEVVVPEPEVVTPEVKVVEPGVEVVIEEVTSDKPLYLAQSETPALPKTADKQDIAVVLLLAVALGATIVLAYNARRYSKED